MGISFLTVFTVLALGAVGQINHYQESFASVKIEAFHPIYNDV